MDVIKAVRELGKAIQQDERFVRYAKAKLANDTDVELQNAIGEFNITRMELDRELNAKTKRQSDMVKITKPTSKVAVYVIPTNEELVIARDTAALAADIVK